MYFDLKHKTKLCTFGLFILSSYFPNSVCEIQFKSSHCCTKKY